MRRLILIPVSFVLSIAALTAALFAFQLYGPQHAVPPADWPFTAESRKTYDPFGEHSVRSTRAWSRDVVKNGVR